MCNWCSHKSLTLDVLELCTGLCHTHIMIRSHSPVSSNLIHFPLHVIYIGRTRRWCNVEVRRDTPPVSRAHGEIFWLHLRSQREWPHMWLTHTRPSKRATRLGFVGTPLLVIPWETGGHHRAADISLRSLDRHMITRHLIWIRRSLIKAGCVEQIGFCRPLKTYFIQSFVELSCCAGFINKRGIPVKSFSCSSGSGVRCLLFEVKFALLVWITKSLCCCCAQGYVHRFPFGRLRK